ncbi:MAG: hypothetical protein Q8M21_05500 [Methylococcaceae bacterium]|nr:hypothetical protein [Methylococcaceae bacterium]
MTHNLAGTAQDNTWTYTRNQVQDIKTATWTNNAYPPTALQPRITATPLWRAQSGNMRPLL